MIIYAGGESEKTAKEMAEQFGGKLMTAEEYKASRMTDAKAAAIADELREVLGRGGFSFRCDQPCHESTPMYDTLIEIAAELMHSIVYDGSEPQDQLPQSSAMCPKAYHPAKWVIGSMGSVWCDLELHDKHMYRIHWQDKTFHVEELEA